MSETSQNPCATCGACCRSYIVPVCGHDIWSICTRQRLNPEAFLVAWPQKDAGRDSFRLERDGQAYALALDKQGRFHLNQPCVFLMNLAGGNARCGVYADRPVVCKAYPMSMHRGGVVQREDSLCPADAWPPAVVGRPSWRKALQRLHMQFDIYYEVIARWNARVAAASPDRHFMLFEFFNYLLNVYDRLIALEDEVGAEALANVQDNWGVFPKSRDEGTEIHIRVGEIPWLDYLTRVRQLVQEFYPEIGATQPASPVLVRAER